MFCFPNQFALLKGASDYNLFMDLNNLTVIKHAIQNHKQYFVSKMINL